MKLHGVLVTYKRPEAVRDTLAALSRQSRLLDSIWVIDNDPSEELQRDVELTRRLIPGLYTFEQYAAADADALAARL